MHSIHLPHIIFDPASQYNRMRRACDPHEKLVGFFDWLDHMKKRGVAPPIQVKKMVAALGPLVIRLDNIDKHVQAYVEVPRGDILPARYEVRFQLPKTDWPPPETPCRVFLLEPETFNRLRENLAAENRPLPDDDDEEAIRLLLREDFLENSAEATRVLSALPELNGTVGAEGQGSASAEVPFGCPNVPKGTHIIVVYERPPDREVK
jgi:hypothetical protein